MANSETTPLQGSSYQNSELNRFVGNLFSKENLDKAQTTAKTHLDQLAQSAREGDVSIRLLALLGGAALVIYSTLGFITHVLMLQFVRALVEIYTLVLGVIILVLESRQLHLPEAFLNRLYKYALFLKFVWGRGCLYFVAGSLQLTQGSLIDVGIGAFVMFVGALYIVVGRQTAQKLRDLRQNLYSEDTLRTKFREADTTGTGKLTMDQFRTLTASLGMNLHRREVEAAFLHLDRDDSGALSFEDFKNWWTNCGSEQFYGEMSV